MSKTISTFVAALLLIQASASAKVIGPVSECSGKLVFLDGNRVVAQFLGGRPTLPHRYIEAGKDGYGTKQQGVVYIIWGTEPQRLSRYEGVTRIVCDARQKSKESKVE